MKIKKYIGKIVADESYEEMKELACILEDAVYTLKEIDPTKYSKFEHKIYELAYGKVISEEMAKEIVEHMEPYGEYWTIEATTRILNDKNYHFTPVDFYVVMNSLKNDYGELFSDSTDTYIKMACKWLEDKDAVEYKTYEYFTHIPRRD